MSCTVLKSIIPAFGVLDFIITVTVFFLIGCNKSSLLWDMETSLQLSLISGLMIRPVAEEPRVEPDDLK